MSEIVAKVTEAQLNADLIDRMMELQELERKFAVSLPLRSVMRTGQVYLAPLDSEYEEGMHEHYWPTFIRIASSALNRYKGHTKEVKALERTLYEFIGNVLVDVNYADYPEQEISHASTLR